MRQNHANHKGKVSTTIVEPIPPSRVQATGSDSVRPQTATQNATPECVVADPDLSAVAAAWPDLPEAIKAGIVAIVKAAKP
jgi:hypothetical protein